MALLHYLKPVNGVPDPRGPLSSSIPSFVIAEANAQVLKETEKVRREVLTSLTLLPYAWIGNNSCQHGVAAASRYFTRKMKRSVSETTVRSIRDA